MIRKILSLILMLSFLPLAAQQSSHYWNPIEVSQVNSQYTLRLLNHWDNPNGTVERGYAGRSIWKWDEIPSSPKKPMPKYLVEKYKEYAQLNKDCGINGTVLNNVNAKPLALSTDMLRKTARIADILRPYGIKVYLSVNFASPKALGDVDTADPLDDRVVKWWKKKADEIYKLIPDFGGFLVKANSEGEPGPMDYGRTHVDGANMLAAASKPHGGIVMWRSFVYSPQGGDRASQAYDEFVRFDGQFSDNVIIQIKNGPIDFQPREPVSPLFFALKKTKMMAEFQITQEYTGNSIQTCYLAPMWREFFDVIKSQNVNLVGVAGVANIGDAGWKNESKGDWSYCDWTSNDLAMANWYAFGCLAVNPDASSYDIACKFLSECYSSDENFVKPMTQMLMKSREAVVNYMMPFGLHHIFAGGHHYGPEPWCAPKGWREDWLPRYYHKADAYGIGFNRTNHEELQCQNGASEPSRVMGSANTQQYPEPLRSTYNNIETCPENLLLWFHHVSWNHTMQNGLTLWDNLCYKYDEGVMQARQFADTWAKMKPYVDAERWTRQMARFNQQVKDAQWWRDACVLYFQQFSGKPIPVDALPVQHELSKLLKYKLNIDNYTAPTPDMLP